MARLSLGAHPVRVRLVHSPVAPRSSTVFPFLAWLLPAAPLRALILGAHSSWPCPIASAPSPATQHPTSFPCCLLLPV